MLTNADQKGKKFFFPYKPVTKYMIDKLKVLTNQPMKTARTIAVGHFMTRGNMQCGILLAYSKE